MGSRMPDNSFQRENTLAYLASDILSVLIIMIAPYSSIAFLNYSKLSSIIYKLIKCASSTSASGRLPILRCTLGSPKYEESSCQCRFIPIKATRSMLLVRYLYDFAFDFVTNWLLDIVECCILWFTDGQFHSELLYMFIKLRIKSNEKNVLTKTPSNTYDTILARKCVKLPRRRLMQRSKFFITSLLILKIIRTFKFRVRQSYHKKVFNLNHSAERYGQKR